MKESDIGLASRHLVERCVRRDKLKRIGHSLSRSGELELLSSSPDKLKFIGHSLSISDIS